MSDEIINDVEETRGSRGTRRDGVRTERRRRFDGTINRMSQFNLDVFDDSQLDLDNYVYRYVADVGGGSRIRQAYYSEYDFVETSEIKDFDEDFHNRSGESSTRYRVCMNGMSSNNPEYGYLMKKPKHMFNEEQDMLVQQRADMMNGVIRGNLDVAPTREGIQLNTKGGKLYVPNEADINAGSSTKKLRGPVKK